MSRLTPVVLVLPLFLLLSQPAGARKKPAKKQQQVVKALRAAKYFEAREQDYETALQFYEKAAKIDKRNEDALRGIANCQLRLDRPKKAIKTLQKLVKVYPKSKHGWYELGSVHQKLGNTKKALAAYNKALGASPAFDKPYLALARYQLTRYKRKPSEKLKKEIIKNLTLFLRTTRTEHSPDAKFASGQLYELLYGELGKTFYEARQAYDQAFKARFGMARHMKKAHDRFKKCTQMKPDFEPAYYFIGLIHLSIKSSDLYDPDLAAQAFGKARHVKEALVELALLARKDGDLTKARTHLEKALKIHPNYARARFELGLTHKLQGNKKKAVHEFEQVVVLAPASVYGERSINELLILSPTSPYIRRYQRVTRKFGGDVFNVEKFKASLSKIEHYYGGVIRSRESEVLNRMANRLLDGAGIKGKVPIKVQVLASSRVKNAFAMPGGHIYFTKAMLDLIQKSSPSKKIDLDNGLLAFVLAHEITHVIKHHTVSRQVFLSAVAGTKKFDPSAVVKITRTYEMQADRLGLVTMFLAGYDPANAIAFLVASARALHEIAPGMDHPTWDERISLLQEYWSNEIRFAFLSYQEGLKLLEEAGTPGQMGKNPALKLRDAIENIERFCRELKKTRDALYNLGVAYYRIAYLATALGSTKPLDFYTDLAPDREVTLKYVEISRKRRAKKPGALRDAGKPDKTQLAAAEQHFKDALRQDPRYEKASLGLGIVLADGGRYDQAQAVLKKITRSKKVGASALNALGVIAARQGKVDDAVSIFEKAVKTSNTSPYYRYNLARVMEKKGMKEAAARQYNQFIVQVKVENSWVMEAKRAVGRLTGQP